MIDNKAYEDNAGGRKARVEVVSTVILSTSRASWFYSLFYKSSI